MLNPAEKYAAAVGELHRKKFGQFFTEERIASFMVGWVLAGKSTSIFDPAFGLGAFYDAAQASGFSGVYKGVEVDQKVLSFFQSKRDSIVCQIDNEDYFSLWGHSQSAIVCNPPYMRFQKIEGRSEVFSSFESNLGIRLSGYTNIASAFLVKSICELVEGGRLAYIMPLEFLNAGYGRLVKRLLIEQGSLHAVVKIDCEKDAFPDATTSVGIILFEKRKSDSATSVYVVNDLNQFNGLLESNPVSIVKSADLLPDEKWLKYFEPASQAFNLSQLVRLSEYGGFGRGIATGANEFFCLNKELIQEIGLEESEFVSCITKSAQIKKAIFKFDDLTNLADAKSPVYLLNVNGHLSSAARKYIEHGEQQGFHNRYLTKTRAPWYKIEKRKPAPLLFGVFSRDGFKVIRNYTNALNLTCYHGFQPNIFGAEYMDALFLYFQSEVGRQILSKNMRRYGDSLDKFEPGDLNDALCPCVSFLEAISKDEISIEMAYLDKHGKLSDKAESIFSDLLYQQVSYTEQFRDAA